MDKYKYMRSANGRYKFHAHLKTHTDEYRFILSINFFFLVISFISRDYSSVWASFDLMATILMFLYYVVIRQLIVQGKIKAYFRQSYAKLSWFLLAGKVVFMGAIFRLAVVGAIYYTNFAWEKSRGLRNVRYIEFIYKYTDIEGFMFAIVGFLALFALIFHSQKYISVVDFIKYHGAGTFEKVENPSKTIYDSVDGIEPTIERENSAKGTNSMENINTYNETNSKDVSSTFVRRKGRGNQDGEKKKGS